MSNLPEEITLYKNLPCTQRTDFVWGRHIKDEVCDDLLEFWDNQRFLTVAPGQIYKEGVPAVD